ncbi:MAG TPA: DUF1801 domain-containing protein [Saprospiraceae bacterium]|nr:DUF1801 domain-containing protein [Saprospiraceae bacterium]
MEAGKKFTTVKEYIDSCKQPGKKLLLDLQSIIRTAAPQAEECISYNMPAYKWNGPLVYFAAAKNHIGFYPTPSPINHFKKELASYQTSKGAIQFPFTEGIPAELVRRIVAFKLEENRNKAAAKSKKVKS